MKKIFAGCLILALCFLGGGIGLAVHNAMAESEPAYLDYSAGNKYVYYI